MLQRVGDVGKGVKLEKFARSGQILPPSVQIYLEVVELAPQVPLALLLIIGPHEGRVHREVDLQVELELLAY